MFKLPKLLASLQLAVFAGLVLVPGLSLAADNAVTVTVGSGVTMRTKDTTGSGGPQSPYVILGDTSGNALATAPGTSNTVFGLPIQGMTGGIAVPISGNVGITGTVTVSGTVTSNQGGAPWTVNPGTAANWAIGATGSGVPANAVLLGMSQSGTLTALTGASGSLNVVCTSGCSGSGGTSLADEGTFTQGTTGFTPAGGLYNTSITPLTSGQGGAQRLTPDRMPVGMNGLGTVALSQWTSGTSANSTQSITIPVSGGPVALVVQFVTNSGTVSGGAITFEGSYDNSNFVTLSAQQLVDPTSTTLAQISNPWTITNSTTKPFMIFPAGMQAVRIRLSTAITGTVTLNGTSTLVSADVANPVFNAAIYSAVIGPLAAGPNTIGKVDVQGNGGGAFDQVQGSSVPANSLSIGANASGNQTRVVSCDKTAVYDTNTSGSTQLVALSSGQNIYICGFNISTGSTATNVKLISGTGTACATGTASLTPAYQLAANSGIVDDVPFYNGLNAGASNALCINTSGVNPAVQALVKYTQF